ncbi:MAG: TIR domain-containing protein [bacterium]
MKNTTIHLEAHRSNKPFIFISYSHDDNNRVLAEIQRLHKDGYRIWYDQGIAPGREWPEETGLALDRCALFIVFISNNSVESKNVRNEINYAFSKGKPILAIHLEETQLSPGLDLQIGHIQAILKYQFSEEKYIKKLYRVLNLRLGEKAYQRKDERIRYKYEPITKPAIRPKPLRRKETPPCLPKHKAKKPSKSPNLKGLILKYLPVVAIIAGILFVMLNLEKEQKAPQISLRETPDQDFSEEEASVMLKDRSFFCNHQSWGNNGTGIANLYEPDPDKKIIKDYITGLVWEKSGSLGVWTYSEARDYVKKRRREAFAEYTDWRLPTLEEAMSLMEPKKLNGSLYLQEVFDRNQRSIWTSDRYGSQAWYVDFEQGNCQLAPASRIEKKFVRVVSSGYK